MDKRVITQIRKIGTADARVILIEERYVDDALQYRTQDKLTKVFGTGVTIIERRICGDRR